MGFRMQEKREGRARKEGREPLPYPLPSSSRVVSRQNCLPLPFRMLATQARENGTVLIKDHNPCDFIHLFICQF